MRKIFVLALSLLSINAFASNYSCNIRDQNGLQFIGDISLNNPTGQDAFFLTENGIFRGTDYVDKDFFKQKLSSISFALVGPQKDMVMVTVTQLKENLPQAMGVFQAGSSISMMSNSVLVSCGIK